MELYQHNQQVYSDIISLINQGIRDICCVQGTGTGKSFIMMKLIHEFFTEKKVLIVIPKLVIEVNANKYAEFDVIKDRTEFLSTANFYSQEHTKAIAEKYDVVIVDEAHHLGSDLYGRNLLYLKDIMIDAEKFFLGFTATPSRDSDGINITEFFETTVYGVSIFQCIKEGLMPKLEYITCSMDLTPEEIKEANVRYHVDIEGSAQLLQEIVRDNPKNSWLVYFARIEDMDIAEADIRMLFSEYTVIKIDSRDSEALKRVEEIRPEDKVVILSVNILLEGLHLPNMEAIMLFRNTTSLIVFQQMIGRIMSIGSKNMPLIVDCSSTAMKLLYKLMNPKKFEGDGIGFQREHYEFREIVYTSVTNKKYFDISLLLQELHPQIYNYHTIEEMQEIAESRGGECLSTAYISSKTKLRWRCAKGHEWESVPDNILAGKWCPICRRGLKTIEEMQELAESMGGKCISTEYKGAFKELAWECANKHRWKASYSSIKKGVWCPKCAGRDRDFLAEIKKIAESKGGKCLSDKYYGATAKHKFQCAKGHIWETGYNIVKKGSWCPVCNGKSFTLEDMRDAAAKHGGKCLATQKPKSLDNVMWECSKGHEFSLSYTAVKKGSWCPVCGKGTKSLKYMQDLAAAHGGKCLAENYKSLTTKVEWECKLGHRWLATATSVKNGVWCAECSGRQKITIETVRKWAKALGGKCLSEEYINCRSKMKFRCSKGHEWETIPDNIKNRHWCPVCSMNKRKAVRLTIENMKELAKNHGGECLSSEYIDQKTHLRWRCDKGHEWTATPITIKRGVWCPECRKIKRKEGSGQKSS